MTIRRSVAASVVLSLLAVASFAGTPASEDDLVKSLVSGAKGVEKTSLKVASNADRQKINAALGVTLTDADFSSPIYKVQAPIDQPPFSKNAEVLVAVVTVPGPKGEIKLGVGVHTYKRGRNNARVLTHVKIFEHQEDKAIEKPEFLNQFLGVTYTAGIQRPVDELKKAIDKSKGTAGDGLKAAMNLNWAMHQIASLWESIIYKGNARDKSGAAQADQLVQVLDLVEKASPKFTFASDQDRQYLKAEFGKFRDEAKSVASAFKSGQFDDIKRTANTAGARYCGGCHGPMQKKFADHRNGMGLADEYFLVDYDVFAPSKTHQEAYQAVATGIKKGILLVLLSQ